jgi:hypothetical protein
MDSRIEAMLGQMMNKMDVVVDKVNQMDGRLLVLETSVQETKALLDNFRGETNERLLRTETSVQETKALLDNFRGETNERLLRTELARKYGESFSKPFNIQGL